MNDVLPIIRTVFISECDESNAFIGLGRTCQDPGDLREDHYRNATVQPQLGDSCNSISALTIKPWLEAERLLLVSDLNTNKTTTTITTSGLGRLGFYKDHRVTGSCWRDS